MNPVKELELDCAVPDCEKKAVGTARIAINNAPKKTLPCCKAHMDAAKEDWIAVQLPTGQVSIDRIKATDDLKKLHSLPPYDGFNPCAGDGFFALSMTKEYGMSICELEQAVGFPKLMADWEVLRQSFLKR